MPERKAAFMGLDRWQLAVFAAYLAMVCFAVLHYQPWEDEGRAWVGARELNLFDLTFRFLRYEGHPALWYWILWPISHLHVPFVAINWIAAASAGSAIYLLLRFAPFPFYLRALLPFSFWLGYEYAVLGRSYCLFPLLGFAVAALYRRKQTKPATMAVALSLLSNLSVHGLMVACGFAAAYAWNTRGHWDTQIRRAAGIFAASLVFVAICIWPTRNVNAPVGPQIKKVLRHVEPVSYVLQHHLPQSRPSQLGGGGGISLRERLRFAFVYPIANWTVVALLFQALVFVYLYRRGAAWLILAPLLLSGLLVGLYLKLWHTGLLWLTLIMVLWAAWDETESPRTATLQNAVALSFALLCMLQLPWTVSAIRYELSHSTYPAEATAAYLETLPPGLRIDGYGLAYTLAPYFRTQVFANDIIAYSEVADPAIDHPDEILTSENTLTDDVEAMLTADGYRESRSFCGTQFFPNQPIIPTCLVFFERAR